MFYDVGRVKVGKWRLIEAMLGGGGCCVVGLNVIVMMMVFLSLSLSVGSRISVYGMAPGRLIGLLNLFGDVTLALGDR